MGKQSSIKDEVHRGVARASRWYHASSIWTARCPLLGFFSTVFRSVSFLFVLSSVLRLASYLQDHSTAYTYLSPRLNLSQPWRGSQQKKITIAERFHEIIQDRSIACTSFSLVSADICFKYNSRGVNPYLFTVIGTLPETRGKERSPVSSPKKLYSFGLNDKI